MADRDVLHVAWRAAGEPAPGVPLSARGTCVRCVEPATGAPFAAVASAQYGDLDRLAGRGAPGALVWCPPCAWGHRHRPLRTRPHLIEVEPCRLQTLDAAGLRRALGGPVGPATAVVVPLSRHRHLVPFAAWGAVTTDDATLRWTRADADRLAVVARLRALGVGEAALRAPEPPAAALVALDLAARAEALARWAALDRWRLERPPWLEVALRATRTPRRGPAVVPAHGTATRRVRRG